jgi:Mg-chelatase subunit ChlD
MSVNQVSASGLHFPVGLKLCTQFATYGPEETAAAMVEVIAAADAPQRGPRLPLEVVYVIDISGSMNSNMDVLNAALQFLCQSTPEHHAISIVVFNSEASVYWPLSKMTSSAKQQLRSKQPLKAEGYTNIAAGVYQGLNQFSTPAERKETDNKQEEKQDLTQRFLVLLSDGLPTHGPNTSDDILTVLQRHPMFSAMQIIAMAIGSETDRDLLSRLALQSQGKLYFVQHLDQLPAALGDCLGSFMSVVASRLSVEIEAEEVRGRDAPPPTRQSSTSCMQSRSTMTSQQVDQQRLAFQLGSLYFGEQRSILIDIPAPFTGFVARIRYLDAATGNPVTVERRLNIPRGNQVPEGQRVEAVDVGVQLLRTEGQQIITRCAESQEAEELEVFEKKLLEGPYAQHPVVKCLLVDIRRLLDLHQEAQSAQMGLSRVGSRQVTGNAYSTACASAGVTLATQQSMQYQDPMDAKEPEEQNEEADLNSDGLDLVTLRRAMSAKCSQHTKSVTKKK